MHKFSPWTEEEFSILSTVVLLVGVIVFLLAFASAFQSSARWG